jgi:hypothetical protein
MAGAIGRTATHPLTLLQFRPNDLEPDHVSPPPFGLTPGNIPLSGE